MIAGEVTNGAVMSRVSSRTAGCAHPLHTPGSQ